jgi:hypothetical protein
MRSTGREWTLATLGAALFFEAGAGLGVSEQWRPTGSWWGTVLQLQQLPLA